MENFWKVKNGIAYFNGHQEIEDYLFAMWGSSQVHTKLEDGDYSLNDATYIFEDGKNGSVSGRVVLIKKPCITE